MDATFAAALRAQLPHAADLVDRTPNDEEGEFFLTLTRREASLLFYCLTFTAGVSAIHDDAALDLRQKVVDVCEAQWEAKRDD